MKKVKAILVMIVKVLIAVLNPTGARQSRPKPGVPKPVHDNSGSHGSMGWRTGDSVSSHRSCALALPPSFLNLLGGILILAVGLPRLL